MATRSIIAIRHPNNSIKAIYCHNGGGIEHNGETLFKYYNTKEKVVNLISLGYLSSLWETLNDTCAYHRDCNQAFEIDSYNNEKEFIKAESNRYTELYYLFDVNRNKWFVLNKRDTLETIDKNGNHKYVKTDNWIHLEKWIYETRRMKAEHDKYIKSLYK